MAGMNVGRIICQWRHRGRLCAGWNRPQKPRLAGRSMDPMRNHSVIMRTAKLATLRVIGIVVASAAAVTVAAFPSSAAESPCAFPDSGPSSCDFRVSGVRIWRYASSSDVLGLGYPGQGFFVDSYQGTEEYMCDNGQYNAGHWFHGRDGATGLTGYVPMCNLVQGR